jgi:hypothetical protein
VVRPPRAEWDPLAISTEMLYHLAEFAGDRGRNDENLLMASDERPCTSQSPMAGDVYFFVAHQERTKDQQLTTGRSGRQRPRTTKHHMCKRSADMANVLPRERIVRNFIGCLTIGGRQQHQSKEVGVIIHGRWRKIRIIRGNGVVIAIVSNWVNVG